jgi:hypothetical protein
MLSLARARVNSNVRSLSGPEGKTYGITAASSETAKNDGWLLQVSQIHTYREVRVKALHLTYRALESFNLWR